MQWVRQPELLSLVIPIMLSREAIIAEWFFYSEALPAHPQPVLPAGETGNLGLLDKIR
jgi:hypothetical protein